MKKILAALLTLTVIGTANAKAIPNAIYNAKHPTYHSTYHSGYRKGKSDAYNNVAKTVFFAGTAIVVGVFIYQLGKQSRWTLHDGQVGYRF